MWMDDRCVVIYFVSNLSRFCFYQRNYVYRQTTKEKNTSKYKKSNASWPRNFVLKSTLKGLKNDKIAGTNETPPNRPSLIYIVMSWLYFIKPTWSLFSCFQLNQTFGVRIAGPSHGLQKKKEKKRHDCNVNLMWGDPLIDIMDPPTCYWLKIRWSFIVDIVKPI